MINIIIPAWNCEKYIRQCLDSLYKQTYKNFRIIVVNDGSTDGTLKILQEYKAKHDNFEIIEQQNSGPSAARNAGLNYVAKTCDNDDYLLFVDADDWAEPDYLKTLVELMGPNVGMTSCGYRWQKRSTKHFKNKAAKVLQFDKTQGISQLFVDKYYFGALWNKLLKLEYAKKLSFNPELYLAEDIYFMIKYVSNLPDNCVLKHSTKDLYHYIRTGGSLSSLGFNPRKLKILDSVPHIRQTALQVGDETLQYVNAWEFLLLIEFLFYTRSRDKILHKTLKERAKVLLKDYKETKSQYRPFRRYANLILWCL